MSLKSYPLGTNPYPNDYEVVKVDTLQCTDMEKGSNKFFVLELQKDKANKYRIYTSYGRTGADYVAKEERFPHNEYEANIEYHKILSSKLRKRSDGTQYKLVKVATVSVGSEVGKTKILSDDIKKDNLDTPIKTSSINLSYEVSRLIERLYKEAGEATQSQLHGSLHTTTSNPLGTLTLSQIEDGKKVLLEVNNWLSANPDQIGKIPSKILSFTNDFYSAIPQQIPLRPKDADGREEWLKKYCLNRSSILDEKSDLLDLLSDVKGMLSGFESSDIGQKYLQLNCHFEFRHSTHGEFTFCKQYIEGSQSRHHSWKLKLKNVWTVKSKAQEGYKDTLNRIGNVTNLFHGTRAANLIGICKHGLLVRPPGAYITGGMFGGSGLYFADQSTKSSQYATARFGGTGSKYGDTAFMFIAEVALGRIKEYQNAQTHLTCPPNGYDSVKGVKGSSLIHNEYIIYDVRQNQLRYLMEFEQH